ncbi:hypothetical protein STEG23_020087 [Scotinomys teguina]
MLVSAVMLLPGTKGLLLLVQRTVTRTIVLQETIGKGMLCCPVCVMQYSNFFLTIVETTWLIFTLRFTFALVHCSSPKGEELGVGA